MSSIQIDGAIGEGSMFHRTFGYYAHGVGPETAILPAGWESRLVRVCNDNTHGAAAWCLDPAHLAASKTVAGRERDRAFVALMISRGLVDASEVRRRLDACALAPDELARATALLERLGRGPETPRRTSG